MTTSPPPINLETLAEDVLEAYYATGLVPIQKTFGDESEAEIMCGCGLTALSLCRGLTYTDQDSDYESEASQYLGMSDDQESAFTQGFDGLDPFDVDLVGWYAAGKAAAELVEYKIGWGNKPVRPTI